jgi:hypothetical protein
VTTLTEIEAAADALPKGQKEQLLAFLAAKLGANWTLWMFRAQSLPEDP